MERSGRGLRLTKAGIEASCLETRSGRLPLRSKGRPGRKGRAKCSTKAEPERAESQEDDGWETITKHPLQDASEDHEYTTKEEVKRAGVLSAQFSVICMSSCRSDHEVSWCLMSRAGVGVSYMPAAPVLLAPLQPIKLHERGLSEMRNPIRPLQ